MSYYHLKQNADGGLIFTPVEDKGLEERHCLRCGYHWVPRNSFAPKKCPACKSPYWQTAKKAPIRPRPSVKKA